MHAHVRYRKPSFRRRWLCIIFGHEWEPTAQEGYNFKCQRCKLLEA